jgi:hypothetical protein
LVHWHSTHLQVLLWPVFYSAAVELYLYIHPRCPERGRRVWLCDFRSVLGTLPSITNHPCKMEGRMHASVFALHPKRIAFATPSTTMQECLTIFQDGLKLKPQDPFLQQMVALLSTAGTPAVSVIYEMSNHEAHAHLGKQFTLPYSPQSSWSKNQSLAKCMVIGPPRCSAATPFLQTSQASSPGRRCSQKTKCEWVPASGVPSLPPRSVGKVNISVASTAHPTTTNPW